MCDIISVVFDWMDCSTFWGKQIFEVKFGYILMYLSVKFNVKRIIDVPYLYCSAIFGYQLKTKRIKFQENRFILILPVIFHVSCISTENNACFEVFDK